MGSLDGTPRCIELPHGPVGTDGRGGAPAAVRLLAPDVSSGDRRAAVGDGAGFLRLGPPLVHSAAHYAETGVHGSPEIGRAGGGLRPHRAGPTTWEGSVAVRAEIDPRIAERTWR